MISDGIDALCMHRIMRTFLLNIVRSYHLRQADICLCFLNILFHKCVHVLVLCVPHVCRMPIFSNLSLVDRGRMIVLPESVFSSRINNIGV